jgi:tRNA(fMet)-specific endonuclease VapC
MRLHYLLDTNICIYIAKQKPIDVLKRFEKMKPGEAGMSVITYGELLYGAEKSQHPKKTKEALSDLVYLIPSLPLIDEVSEHYARIRASLEKQGKTIGNNDLWIASHAQTLGVILVTNNIKEFSRVPHLKVENWI